MRATADAFMDESGQRSKTRKSSDHFVMSAVMVRPGAVSRTTTLLTDMRRELGRGPGDELAWKKLRSHQQRVRAAQMLGGASFLRISSVIVCKRDFDPGKGSIPDEDFAYLYTFRFLLERLSWWARDMGVVSKYTLAHIIRFRKATLRRYESILRNDPECRVEWDHLDQRGGGIDQPSRLEQLQLADLAASATAQAFEPDQFGNVEVRYLEELRPRLYRHGGGVLTSYGLKMHPWNAKSQADHKWLLGW